MTDQILEVFEQRPLELPQFRAPQVQQSHQQIMAPNYEVDDPLMLEYGMLESEEQPDSNGQQGLNMQQQQHQQQHQAPALVSDPTNFTSIAPLAANGQLPWQERENDMQGVHNVSMCPSTAGLVP